MGTAANLIGITEIMLGQYAILALATRKNVSFAVLKY